MRGFIQVEELELRSEPAVLSPFAEAPLADTPADVAFLPAEPADAWEARTNLFGDPER